MSSSATFGGNRGSEFKLLPNDPAQTIQRLDVWIDDHEGSQIVSKIKVFWRDGTSGSAGRDASINLHTHNFDEDEIITEFTIYAGEFVDGIAFKTNKLAAGFAARGPGGSGHRVDVGNGKLRGFTGRSGYDVDALSVTFN
jgi:hypothetical protein